MKFLVDMPLSPKTVKFLKNMGYETRVSELGMAKSKDRDIFDYAEKNDMIILSADLNFGTILAFTHSIKPSVIIFRLMDPSPEHVNSLLSSNLSSIEEELMKGAYDIKTRIRQAQDKVALCTNAAIVKQPVSQSGYKLTRALPENLRSSLPGIEELEAEPGGIHKEESGDE